MSIKTEEIVPPFGYIRKTNWRGKVKFVPHPDRNEIVESIFERYASGEKSLKELSEEFPALREKLTTPSRWQRFLLFWRG